MSLCSIAVFLFLSSAHSAGAKFVEDDSAENDKGNRGGAIYILALGLEPIGAAARIPHRWLSERYLATEWAQWVRGEIMDIKNINEIPQSIVIDFHTGDEQFCEGMNQDYYEATADNFKRFFELTDTSFTLKCNPDGLPTVGQPNTFDETILNQVQAIMSEQDWADLRQQAGQGKPVQAFNLRLAAPTDFDLSAPPQNSSDFAARIEQTVYGHSQPVHDIASAAWKALEAGGRVWVWNEWIFASKAPGLVNVNVKAEFSRQNDGRPGPVINRVAGIAGAHFEHSGNGYLAAMILSLQRLAETKGIEGHLKYEVGTLANFEDATGNWGDEYAGLGKTPQLYNLGGPDAIPIMCFKSDTQAEVDWGGLLTKKAVKDLARKVFREDYPTICNYFMMRCPAWATFTVALDMQVLQELDAKRPEEITEEIATGFRDTYLRINHPKMGRL